jgi:hypothetical protein
MSVEAAEAKILADQMQKNLIEKKVAKKFLKDYERLQKIGFINKDLSKYDNLVGGMVDSVKYRGNSVVVKLDNNWNLLIGPEYGGRIRYHRPSEDVEDFHLKIDFMDGSVLSIRLTNMGVLQVAQDQDLEKLYLYKRDFSETPSPLDPDFSYEY